METGGLGPTIAAHPSYANPTITEAVWDIHFQLSPEAPWQPSAVGEFFKRVQTEYPTMEPQQEIGFQVEFGLEGLVHRVVSPRQRVRFLNSAGNLIIQFGDGALSVNALAPYPGWASLRPEALRVWAITLDLLNIGSILRLGLRYINRFPRVSENDSAGSFLKPSDYIPVAVLNSKSGVLSRVETSSDGGNRTIVTVAESAPSDTTPFGAYIYDIDRIIDHELSTSVDIVGTEMDRLHEDVWQVFHSAQTDRLVQLLSGEKNGNNVAST